MMQQLRDMASTGLDLSPGDRVAAWAVVEIARLKAEIEQGRAREQMLCDSIDRQLKFTEESEGLLKAALRWLVTEGRDGCIETPPEFAAVIADAGKP